MKCVLTVVAMLAGIVCLRGIAWAQSVVTDPGLTAATMSGMATNAAKLAEQLVQMRQQLQQAQALVEQAQAQHRALTGTRSMGSIFSDPAYRDYLPADWQGLYDKLRAVGDSGLTGPALGVRRATYVFDACKGLKDIASRLACQASAAKPAVDKAVAVDAFGLARHRLEQIEALMRAINTTSDPKGIAELSARLAAEQAALQNETMKLQLYALISKAEADIVAQQQKEADARRWQSRQGLRPPPLTFP